MIGLTDDSHYKAISNAIRALNGGTETYTPAEMAEYLATQGVELKPENIRKDVTIFGVTGTYVKPEPITPEPPILPEGYTVLDYIGTTGSQYIDTGFIPNQDTRIDIVTMPFDINDAGANGVGFVPYGSAISYYQNAFECYSTQHSFEINYGNTFDFVGNIAPFQKVTISQDKNVVTITVGTEKYSYIAMTNTFTAPYTMTLFATHRATPLISGQMRIYSCQIYDNGTLVRDFVPCINANEEIGMYDKANKVFYGNAGTSVFFAGQMETENN